MGDNVVIQTTGTNQNMSLPSQHPFAMTPEEMAFVTSGTRRTGSGHVINTDHRGTGAITHGTSGNITIVRVGETLNEESVDVGQNYHVENTERESFTSSVKNNKATCEDLETLRENIKNNRDSLKKRSSANVLTIEQASRGRSRSIGTIDPLHLQALNHSNSRSFNTLPDIPDKDAFNNSTGDLRNGFGKESDVFGIDLLNRFRTFYFNHQKSLEGVKQSVRSAKHRRAREKMEGKQSSGLETAMDILSSEMAELMDQDLSLMAQLLKLNDKIEEIKASHRQSEFLARSSWSVNEISDSEYSDTDDSRIDLYSASTGSYITKSFRSLQSSGSTAETGIMKTGNRKRTPDEDDIIHVTYRKKQRKGRKRHRSRSNKGNSSADDTSSAVSSTDDDVTYQDTDSTLSGISDDSDDDSVIENNIDGTDTDEPNAEANGKEAKGTEEPPVPRVGGISHNQCFAKFHQTNDSKPVTTSSKSHALLGQGHNIPLDKYYVPQGLVYLKHANAENVFCQFTH